MPILRHECSFVNLLHIFVTSFPDNDSRGVASVYSSNKHISGGQHVIG